MFNYKRPKKYHNRYNSEEYKPRIIDKLYKLGGNFSYDQNNSQMNYSIKLKNLKLSTKELNNEIKFYREDLDNAFKENNKIKVQLKNNYHNIKKELYNNIEAIKNKIDNQNIQQKNFNMHISNELLDLKNNNYKIQNLINNISLKIGIIHKKISDKNKNKEDKKNLSNYRNIKEWLNIF